ncbi:gliding motility-associated C-terminal domain-containing protein [Hymenobacter lutimineralis]|uniref:Gliding motility-associated C-terminal domain-containing protein n=1 Tax=Hymenobacter lutimineralis TaxID=2606448 RepID=A0A5D6VDM7_9BACT|nr:gliding motility-associated C-terminal domain-containing protein [Hymenobacter lutimineralis]TYZ13387.1 gliding motility-associated C-terminal domain-containing protein [Hymenobacter lutimineralis]
MPRLFARKLQLPWGVFLLALMLLGVGSQRGWASHAQGGQLTYQALGNNQYRVSCQFFRDCSGEPLNPDLRLYYRASGTGCAEPDPRSGDILLERVGEVTMGNPYCSAVGTPCGSRLRTNFQTARYEATLTLPPDAEWLLYVTIPQRPAVANVDDSESRPLHFEARLRTLVNGEVVENTSPQFLSQDTPVPFVCWRQLTTLTFSATEPDGDSLVYTLADPLAVCAGPAPWARYPGSVDNTNPQCQVIDPGGAYSAAFPIPSFARGTCTSGSSLASPDFRINDFGRSVTFRPALYTPGLDIGQQAQNKYVLVARVSEYRQLRGKWEFIGSVRRDMLVVVLDCEANQVPNVPLVTAPGFPAARIFNTDSTLIEVPVGQLTEAQVAFTDPNSADLLTVAYPELDPAQPTVENPELLPAQVGNFALAGNQTAQPLGKLRLQPPAAYLGKSFRIPLRIEDNACPAKAVQNRVLVVKVVPYVAPRPLQTYNVFSPNGDNINDAFVIDALPPGSGLRVYNRWGRLVQEFADYRNNWKGEKNPAGLYYFILTPAVGAPVKGWVELVR